MLRPGQCVISNMIAFSQLSSRAISRVAKTVIGVDDV